jgi:hypothetical protein
MPTLLDLKLIRWGSKKSAEAIEVGTAVETVPQTN